MSLSKENIKKANAAHEYIKNFKIDKQAKAKIHQRNKIIFIIVGSILGFYLLGVLLFTILSYPRTIVADTDVSFQTSQTMENNLSQVSHDYTLHIKGNDFSFKLPGNKVDFSFDTPKVVKKIFSSKNPFLWPFEIFLIHDFKDNSVVDFNRDKATSIIKAAMEKHNSTAILPQEPTFDCDIGSKTATIKEEVIGNTINIDAAIETSLSYIGAAMHELELTDKEHLTPKLSSKDPRINKAIEEANKALKADFLLLMDRTQISRISTATTAKWLYLNLDYHADLSEEALAQWSLSLEDNYNTLGKSRTYTTPYGKTVTVIGGDKGWKIDKNALIDTTKEKTLEGNTDPVSVPCSSKLKSYNGVHNKDWGSRYIDIDLTEQKARFYNDSGNLAWETDIVSGRPDGKHATPTGVWTINSKESPSKLIGEMTPEGKPEYETTVSYWMPFVKNSIGLHDASWQRKFGGDLYTTSAGSHGCINLSPTAAAALYSICSVGDVVVTHN